MKTNLLILFLLNLCFFSEAQINFHQTYGASGGDFGNSARQTSDGGYIIVGSTLNFGAGFFDVYLIKTDANGDTLWTKTFGETNDDRGNSVQQTTDGGYIIAGTSSSFGTGGIDVYLIKTNANGDLLWSKTLGGTGDDYARFVQQTSDGGYIIDGYTYSFGTIFTDIYLIKTDANGNLLWSKTFGGTNSDYTISVQQTNDGGYILCGTAESYGAGGSDIYLIKTDTIGDLVWTKTYGGTVGEEGNSVQQTSDGGYIVAGYTYSFGAGNSDIYLIRTDANGDTLWSKTYGGTNADLGFSVRQTTDGGFIISGNTLSFGAGNGDIYLIKTDTIGDVLWTKAFGGTGGEAGYSYVRQTIDGGYIISGKTYSFGFGNGDFYLIKTDSSGNSGCNEFSTNSIVTAPLTQVTSPITSFALPPTTLTNPFTVAGSGGAINTICTNVGINELVLNYSFIISPNPSAGRIIISFERALIKGNVEILNILGENIFSENIFNETKKEINLKNISAGVYFVKVFDGEKMFTKKLIIN